MYCRRRRPLFEIVIFYCCFCCCLNILILNTSPLTASRWPATRMKWQKNSHDCNKSCMGLVLLKKKNSSESSFFSALSLHCTIDATVSNTLLAHKKMAVAKREKIEVYIVLFVSQYCAVSIIKLQIKSTV